MLSQSAQEAATAAPQALLVLNRVAGTGHHGSLFAEIIRTLRAAGYSLTVHVTSTPNDIVLFLRDHIAAADIIVCCGGDGTLNDVVNALVPTGEDVPIYYFPCGTTNDLAHTLGLPDTWSPLVYEYGSSDPTPIDAGVIDGNHLFAYVATFGLFTTTAYLTRQSVKNRFGYAAYIVGLLRSIGTWRRYRATVTTDTSHYSGDFLYGSVSNSTRIGNFVRFRDDDVSLTDGRLELLLIRYPENPIVAMRTLIRLLTKRFDDRYIVFSHVHHVAMEFEDPVTWVVDGEYLGWRKDVRINAKPHAYRMFTKPAGTQ